MYILSGVQCFEQYVDRNVVQGAPAFMPSLWRHVPQHINHSSGKPSVLILFLFLKESSHALSKSIQSRLFLLVLLPQPCPLCLAGQRRWQHGGLDIAGRCTDVEVDGTGQASGDEEMVVSGQTSGDEMECTGQASSDKMMVVSGQASGDEVEGIEMDGDGEGPVVGACS